MYIVHVSFSTIKIDPGMHVSQKNFHRQATLLHCPINMYTNQFKYKTLENNDPLQKTEEYNAIYHILLYPQTSGTLEIVNST